MKRYLTAIIISGMLLAGCATTEHIKIMETQPPIWLGSSDGIFDFQGHFVSIDYSGMQVTGLKIENATGRGWKRVGIKAGDILVGIAGIIFMKSDDWKAAWKILNLNPNPGVVIGILTLEGQGEYDKEVRWLVLKR